MWRCAVLLSVCWVGLAVEQRTYSSWFRSLRETFQHKNDIECGKNEYYNRCTYSCPPEQTCDTRKILIYCTAALTRCRPKCICKEGYYRKNEGGECIPEEQCGPACREGEVYTECKNPCVDESCAAMGSLKPNCTEPCVPGCACKEGFFRPYGFWPCLPKCYCHEWRDIPECRH